MKQNLQKILRLSLLFFLFGCGFLTLEEPESLPPLSPADPTSPPQKESPTAEVESTIQLDPEVEDDRDESDEPTPPSASATQSESFGPVVTPTFFPAEYSDTSLQLETYDAFWQAVSEEYVYPDYNGVDWDGIRSEYRTRVESGMSNPEFWAMLTEMVYLLDDEHSYFISTDEIEGERSLRDSGVGHSGVGATLIGRPEQGDVLVAWSVPGNGLYEAGIRDGDRLIAVNGHPLCCEPNGEVFDFLRGPDGSTAEVTYQAAGAEIQTVEVLRNPITINELVEYEKLDGNIGYIQINSFLSLDVARLFEAAWTDLNSPNQLDGIIIDLRTNTGGLVLRTNSILSTFYTGIWHYYYAPYAKNGSTIKRDGGGDDVLGSQTVPMVILVGEATNSQGEVFAGILRDGGRAQLVGRPTQGNIEVLNPFPLPDGSVLYLATDSYVPVSLDDWEEDGLTLDVEVDQRYGEINSDGYDEALEVALDLLER